MLWALKCAETIKNVNLGPRTKVWIGEADWGVVSFRNKNENVEEETQAKDKSQKNLIFKG